MKRVLLIGLSLVLALVGWSTVGAEDGFYVIPAMKGKYAPVPKTGQTASYGTKDDGALQNGVASPTPRFTDNNNGTVTDNLTKLIWMKNANIFAPPLGVNVESAMWLAANLEDDEAQSWGLKDKSKKGDWRLPNLRELQSLVDYATYAPPLPAGNPFTGVQQVYYWTSTTKAGNPNNAWLVHFYAGRLYDYQKSYSTEIGTAVWCVRGGP